MKTDLSKYNNDWYKPGNPIKRICWFFTNSFFFKSSFFPVSFLKVLLLKCFGAKIGKGVTIKPNVNIKYPWNLHIEDYVWIGENVWIDNLAKVKIDSDVCISQGAFLLTGNHNYKKETFDLFIGEIKLEEGVWIGAQSTVSPGITCKSHSILSVQSVAIKDLEPYSIYQGNPATFLRKRIFENDN
jgi:putative colanic acid biosynthesis acetyltransferase WcaF